MGRLSGFSYREVVRRLRTFGFQFDRQGPGSHEIWRHSQTGRKVTIPHHSGDRAGVFVTRNGLGSYCVCRPPRPPPEADVIIYRHEIDSRF